MPKREAPLLPRWAVSNGADAIVRVRRLSFSAKLERHLQGVCMRPMSPARFNALAGYCRQPGTTLVYEEIGWFEHANERVLGMLLRDHTDNDFSGIVYGRDRLGRFRCIYVLPESESTARRARSQLRHAMEQLAMAPNEAYHQGDEEGEPLDFLTPQVPRETLNVIFRDLIEKEQRVAARRLIAEMMKWYEDPDGNFVQQFQTDGFDARLWELYLFAAFREMGYAIDRSEQIPDFTCKGVFCDFTVEAVTVNPSKDNNGTITRPPLESKQDIDDYFDHYVPARFARSLNTKLAKEYWKRPNVEGKPFLLALQDFSDVVSMLRVRPWLRMYLYGYDHKWERDENGQMQVYPQRLTVHRRGRRELPSGFFFQPDTENISAVLFNSSGTIAKFNRMGVLAGFGSARVRMTRIGCAAPSDPNQAELIPFQIDVNASDYSETWVEGLDVFHNPNAKYPIDPVALPGAAHYHLLPDGRVIVSPQPAWYPLFSVTHVDLQSDDAEAPK